MPVGWAFSGLIRGRGMGAGSDGGDTGPAAAAVGNVAGVITLNQVFRPRTTLWGGDIDGDRRQ